MSGEEESFVCSDDLSEVQDTSDGEVVVKLD